jgi:hypothetical protein
MTKKGFATTVAYSYALYDSNGDAVVATYEASKALAKTDAQIKADMAATIDQIKITKPTAFRHTADFSKLQVLDIAPSSVSNPKLFNKATSPGTDSRIQLRYSPYTNPYDKAFHLEIPQPAAGASDAPSWATYEGSPAIASQIEEENGSETPNEATDEEPGGPTIARGPIFESPLPIPPPGPLSPATALAFTDNVAIATGAVGTGRSVFSFDAISGNRLTAALSVTGVLPGTLETNDDTVVWLFDATGKLLVNNDDTDPYGTDSQSLIDGFQITAPGTYYLAATTFGNQPILGAGGIITGWEDDGGSNVTFDLNVQLLPGRFQIRRASEEMGAVEWSEPGILQSADDLSGPWTNLPQESSPYFFFFEGDRMFFRLETP